MTTATGTIDFGEWLPDLPDHENPGAITAENVVPLLTSYGQLPSIEPFTNALDDPALGSFWLQDDDNNVFNFVGDTDKLYRLIGGDTWTDVSGTSAPYNADNWEFTKFGERIIAVCAQAPPQFFDLNVSAVFADLPGAAPDLPPRARRVATVRDFVVLGDTQLNAGGGGDTVGASFIQWSGFNNSELWGSSISTQADFNRIPGRGGRVERIVPGDYGVIFQENSISRMDYVGPPVIFQIDEIEARRGTPAGGSVVWRGGLIYYFGRDAFYVFDGQSSTSISGDKTSRWFIDNSDPTAWDSMRGVIDRQNRLILWAFRSSVSLLHNDRLLIYNWVSQRWSTGTLNTQILDEFVSPGFTLDELDSILPGGIDSNSINVDSNAFQNGFLSVQGFDETNTSGTFNGPPLTSIIDTKEISGDGHNRLYMDAIRPLVEGQSPTTLVTAAVGSRNSLQDNVIFSPLRATNGKNGEVNLRRNARYMRYRLQISGGFRHAKGVKVNISERGGRR